MNSTFNKTYEIRSFDTDMNQKAKLSALFGFFQETASLHAEALHVGFDDLKTDHQTFWALSRLTIVLDDYPKWKDQVTFETWPKGYNRIFARRDFLLSVNQKVIGRGTSDWVVIDKKTRTLVNPSQIVSGIKYNENKQAIKEGAVKIRKFEPEQPPFNQFSAHYNNLDMNNHVNSIRYLDWCMACLPTELLKQRPVQKFSVNYQNEVPDGKNVNIYLKKRADHANVFTFLGEIDDSRNVAFLLELHLA